jgi:hypothetical protein
MAQNDGLAQIFTIAKIISFTHAPVKWIIPVTRQQAGHSRQFHGVRLVMVGDATGNLPLTGPGLFSASPRDIRHSSSGVRLKGLGPPPR